MSVVVQGYDWINVKWPNFRYYNINNRLKVRKVAEWMLTKTKPRPQPSPYLNLTTIRRTSNPHPSFFAFGKKAGIGKKYMYINIIKTLLNYKKNFIKTLVKIKKLNKTCVLYVSKN